MASRIINNLQTLDSVPAYATCLPTGRSWPTRTARRWELLMQKRVDAEAARIEAERERIRQEEERKAQAAAEAKAEAERARIRAEEQHKGAAEAAERLKSEQEAAARQPPNQAIASREAIRPEAVPESPLHLPRPLPRLWTLALLPIGVGSAADEAPTLTLGAINERLHPISISAAGLANSASSRWRRKEGRKAVQPVSVRAALPGHRPLRNRRPRRTRREQ